MALIKCEECKQNISDKAEVCPHCGVPIKKKQEQDVTGCVGCLVIIGIIIYFILGPSNNSSTSKTSTSQTTTIELSNEKPYRNGWTNCFPDFGSEIKEKEQKDSEGTFIFRKFHDYVGKEIVYFKFISTFETAKLYVSPKTHKFYRYYCENKYDLASVGFMKAQEKYKGLCRAYSQVLRFDGKETVSNKSDNKSCFFNCSDGVTIHIILKKQPFKSKSGIDTFDTYLIVDAVSTKHKNEFQNE